MRIINEPPPKSLLDAISVSGLKPELDHTVFTYGDVLYNPGGHPISNDLMCHEETHERQQKIGKDVWWKNYLKDSQFRLEQELEAYRNQYAYYAKRHGNINKRSLFLHRIASDLASPMYGSIVSLDDAKRAIINV